MKKITNLVKQEIILEGFGFIEISESIIGGWQIDLFPKGSENDRKKIQLETTFSAYSNKYFEFPKEDKNRIDVIYNKEN